MKLTTKLPTVQTVRKDSKMKDRKTICEKATERILAFLTCVPTDDCQRRIQNNFNDILNEELEFSKTNTAHDMPDEKLFKHFDYFVTKVAIATIESISNELVYADMFDDTPPKSLKHITFADIGLADWFKIIVDTHTRQIEKELGIYRVDSKDDFDKVLNEIRKTIFSED